MTNCTRNLHFKAVITKMTDRLTTEDINAEYRRKIPVFAEDIDDEDSNDYLMYKVTRTRNKVQINFRIYPNKINVYVPAMVFLSNQGRGINNVQT